MRLYNCMACGRLTKNTSSYCKDHEEANVKNLKPKKLQSPYFRLETSFPLNTKTMLEDTERVEDIVGRPYSDAGSGMGQRDVGWVFQMEATAKIGADRLRAKGYKDTRIIKYEDKKA